MFSVKQTKKALDQKTILFPFRRQMNERATKTNNRLLQSTKESLQQHQYCWGVFIHKGLTAFTFLYHSKVIQSTSLLFWVFTEVRRGLRRPFFTWFWPGSCFDLTPTQIHTSSTHSMILASPTLFALIFLAVSRHVHIEPKIQIFVTKLLMININTFQNASKHMLINPEYYEMIASFKKHFFTILHTNSMKKHCIFLYAIQYIYSKYILIYFCILYAV